MEKSNFESINQEKLEKINVFAQKISHEIANLREIREGGHAACTFHNMEDFNGLLDIIEEIKKDLFQDYVLEKNERYNTPDYRRIRAAGYEDYFSDLENRMAEFGAEALAADLPEMVVKSLKQAEEICSRLKIKFEL
jgi:hypothetical protein